MRTPRKPFPTTVSPYATEELRQRVFAARFTTTLPPVRPLQPSQWDHGPVVRMRYRLQDLRDRWQMRRGKTIDERCRHCWRVLKRFSKLTYVETFLKAPGEVLCKRTWKHCAVCGSRTSDSYLYKRYPSDSWFSWASYNHVFGV